MNALDVLTMQEALLCSLYETYKAMIESPIFYDEGSLARKRLNALGLITDPLFDRLLAAGCELHPYFCTEELIGMRA